MPQIKIYDPVGELPKANKTLVPPLENVQGKSVGFRIQWPNFEVFMETFEDLLREKYHPKQVVKLDLTGRASGPASVADRGRAGNNGVPRQMDSWAKQIDWAVLGLAA